MTADFGFIPHAAQCHAHELAVVSHDAIDLAKSRSCRRPEGPTKHRIGALSLVYTLLHGEVFQNALSYLVERVVITLEHFFRVRQVIVDLRISCAMANPLAYRCTVCARQWPPADIGDISLSFLNSAIALSRASFGILDGGDLLLDFVDVGTVVTFAQFLLESPSPVRSGNTRAATFPSGA